MRCAQTFFCGGRVVTGPGWTSLILTASLIVVVAVLYNALVVPILWHELSVAFLIIGIAFPLWCLAQLFLTGCKDPGVIPRQPPPDPPGRNLPRTKEVEIREGKKVRKCFLPMNGFLCTNCSFICGVVVQVTVRWNDSTNFYQPPRAHHCSVNNDCIERFDHHCPWVGTTIGRRNYRNFLLFVYSTTLLCMYVFATCALQVEVLRQEEDDDGESNPLELALQNSGAAIAIMGVVFFFLFFVGILAGFHTYLISTNQTTYENLRYNYDPESNPYNRGCLRNCMEVWCMDASTCNVDFTARADQAQAKGIPPALKSVLSSPEPGHSQDTSGSANEKATSTSRAGSSQQGEKSEVNHRGGIYPSQSPATDAGEPDRDGHQQEYTTPRKNTEGEEEDRERYCTTLPQPTSGSSQHVTSQARNQAPDAPANEGTWGDAPQKHDASHPDSRRDELNEGRVVLGEQQLHSHHQGQGQSEGEERNTRNVFLYTEGEERKGDSDADGSQGGEDKQRE